ncbi:hypothetical protein Tsubulata_034991 [Turnera subulata]|uniref:Uncharacterized protein n=1 Tax=Turnera subulata TaxID=218843 RepID=A0A9Q0JI67_9ROSI|nr:hypothetical protein Tsubulata_034991 [Turnera subulata]
MANPREQEFDSDRIDQSGGGDDFEDSYSHFEPAEVGMLARCFCIPLVSIRVGKINKQGTTLCPTASRGNLSLSVLPTSDLRLSFIGDDGNTERLFTLSSKAQNSAVAVDEIPADSSGRSFVIKIPDDRHFYFWCSEKSKLLGMELIAKMKDILKRKPSVAELTGISKSRLDCFATQLRAHLLGGSSSKTTIDLSDTSSTSKSFRSRHIGAQAGKASSYQGSLSPRSSSFKEGVPRSLSTLRNATREKLRRRGESHLSAVDNFMVALPHNNEASSSNKPENDKLPEVGGCSLAPSDFLESLGKLTAPVAVSQISVLPSGSSSLFSPYYCWCPPGLSSVSSQFPTSSVESPLLPPLSSLLSAARSSSFIPPTPPLSFGELPSLDFPALLPEPLVRLPMPSSQQIPTFTPLMCDPIVHIPVIDVCSSGQGYLVSAGPTISTTIPPLHASIVNPLIPGTDSVVDKGARETLRLLISGSSQANPQLLDVLPAVLASTDEKKGILASGSRSLYTGTNDVNAIASGIATMGLVSLSGNLVGDVVASVGGCNDNFYSLSDHLDAQQEGFSALDESRVDGKGLYSNEDEGGK